MMDCDDQSVTVKDTGQSDSQDDAKMEIDFISEETNADGEENLASEVRNNLDILDDAPLQEVRNSPSRLDDAPLHKAATESETPSATETTNCSLNKLEEDTLCKNQMDTVVTPATTADRNEVDSKPSKSQEELHDDIYEGAHKTLVQTLGLTNYFPEKISMKDVMLHSSGKLECLSDIPWYMLSKILRLDYRGREDIISNVIEKSILVPERNEDFSEMSEEDFDDFFSHLTDFHPSKNFTSLPHPLDVLVLVFLSSSNFLRQILCEKLFMCKLCIPLVIPPVYNAKSTFFLWSLRSIALESKLASGELIEISAVKHHLPVVSCIRLGEISRSKSKFLNEIINGQSHPTFFHRDCPNGMNPRFVSEGLLEIAWYFPSAGQSNFESLDENLAFINLRGDGISNRASHNKTFLFRISSLVLVMVDINELEDQNICTNVEEIASNCSQMLLMFTKKGNGKPSKKDIQGIKRCAGILKDNGYGKDNMIFDFDGNGERNIKLLRRETEDKIKSCYKAKPKQTTLESYKDIAEKMNIDVDENMHECNHGKKMAFEIVKKVCKNGIDNLKAENLPLQCKPWQEWARLKTEEHRREKRGTEDMSNYMDKLSTQMSNLRNEQLCFLKDPNNVMCVFTEYLLHSVKSNNLYFLKWLKLSLDEISRKTLPELQRKCSFKWNEIRKCEDTEKQKYLQEEFGRCEEELAESSFGLEHFMREIAQAYEAVHYMGKETSGKIEEKTRMLPNIMANLILLGYPVELMDGDAAHIPLKWVQAVLGQLSKLVGNKKVFVLSVLGIQSSGKSTLLNTMFGLQFSVAAGRCTRGVYAQLIPISVEYSCSKYDYILVVDTEGLRASELGKAKLQHDNEIATFVIGLGDVTLVNVKGENVSEMEDVLQIVIHALLKMSLVNRNLKLQPSIIFVHQNVSAPDASQKLRTGQQKFMETLDKVTKAAGKEEDAPQYTKFKQLIDFDINTNIWYISDLWRGDPPMAPANPGYSDNVNRVKQMLLTRVMQNRSLKLTVNKFSTRLKDVWNGILDQNFVFSFKNSLELESYNALEKELSNAIWPLKEEAIKCLNTAKNRLENRKDDLNQMFAILRTECENAIDTKHNEAQEKLQNFFAINDDSSLLEQWRVSIFLRLQSLYDDIIERTTENLKREIAKQKIKVDQKKDMQIYIGKVMDEAKKLVEYSKLHDNGIVGEEELNCRFREKWDDWMQMLPQAVRDDISVENRINDVLEKTFKHDLPLLRDAQRKRGAKILHCHFQYAIEKYGKRAGNVLVYFKRLFNNKFDMALSLMNDFQAQVDKQCSQTSEQECIDYVQTIFRMVSDMVTEMKNVFSFTDENKFEIYMAVFVCQYVCGQYSSKYSCEIIKPRNCELTKFGIHPVFEQNLLQTYSSTYKEVKDEIKVYLQEQTHDRDFPIDMQTHTLPSPGKKNKAITLAAQNCVNDLFVEVQSYIKDYGIQCFREEYIEEIIHKVSKMEERENSRITFTKKFRIELAVYLCQYTVPILCEKHEKYIEDTDQRFVYERDNYRPCLESFKNFYYNFTGEQAVAGVLSERLTKAIENAVDKDMAMILASDVRHNVCALSGKPAFLKAILRSLLEEDNFDEYFLYLKNTDACFERWLTRYIDAYLFGGVTDGHNRYSKLAFQRIESLVSTVCQKIEPIPSISEVNTCSNKVLKKWLEIFCQELEHMLPLPCEDLLSLASGYDILSLESFTCHLKTELKEKEDNVKRVFENHLPVHQRIYNENVYSIVGEECKGCTAKCPFCSVPCYLNTYGHIEMGRKHMALEHYPQGCGGWRYSTIENLVVDNCSLLVAGDISFFCKERDWRLHPYKRYQEIYPDWEIHGDPSVDATPYWKWFLKTYAQQLADRYKAKLPHIPLSWKRITKKNALDALKQMQ